MHPAFRTQRVCAFAAMLWLAFAMAPAHAQRTEGDRVASARGLYEAEVNVNGQGEGERNTGFARALSQVLAKLTGTRSVAGMPGVGQELRHARDFVKSYDYRQDEGRSATGADGAADALSRKYAKRSTAAGTPGRYTVQVQGIDDSEDYLRLMSYLQGLPVVRGVSPVRAGAEGLVLELDLLTGLPGLRRMVGNGDVLAVDELDPSKLHLR